MSIELTKKAWQAKNLSARERIVLLAMTDTGGTGDNVSFSFNLNSVAKAAQIDKPAVLDIIQVLVSKEVIERDSERDCFRFTAPKQTTGLAWAMFDTGHAQYSVSAAKKYGLLNSIFIVWMAAMWSKHRAGTASVTFKLHDTEIARADFSRDEFVGLASFAKLHGFANFERFDDACWQVTVNPEADI
jgi:hypothetical protein